MSMTFGKMDDISGVDFTLPRDNPITEKTLSIESNAPLEVYFGPPEWGVKGWLGKIYKSDTKEENYLKELATQFNSVELNTFFYGIKDSETIKEWKAKVTGNFKFCPKFPKTITHERKLIGAEAETELFCNAVLGFGNNLGRNFMQFSENYPPGQFKHLENYLRYWPKNLPISVELRHEKWFSDKLLWQDTCAMFQELGVGTVINDTAGRRDVVHMSLTNNSLMLRFLTNDLETSAYSRIDEWCLKIKDWIAQGLKTIYIFVHTLDKINVPELILYWVKKLNETCNLRIQQPRITPRYEQGSLF